MDFIEFNEILKQKATQIQAAQPALMTKLAGAALRFVDDNFRNQSWEGKPWKTTARGGTVLVNKGDLRRSFNQDIQSDAARIYSNVKYAAVHNEGFTGEETVRAHKRSQYKRTGRGKKIKTGTGDVKSYKRKMNIAQRQYAPTKTSPSPTLTAKTDSIIHEHFMNLLNP